MAAAMAQRCAQGLLSLVVPMFPGEVVPFGPIPLQEVALAVVLMTGCCGVAGLFLTRSSVLLRAAGLVHKEGFRDEAWDELKLDIAKLSGKVDLAAAVEEADPKYSRKAMKRLATELLFICVHNGAVCLLAALAWLVSSPTLALYAFALEVAYEIFDTATLGLQRMEPETLLHHIVSPICILCSTQTEVDFRVLCHLCICIDLSGSILGYNKFLLRYGHVSAVAVYRRLAWMYGALRVAWPLVDTVIILYSEYQTRGTLFNVQPLVRGEGQPAIQFHKTDMLQIYMWAMSVLNAFNIYFFLVIRTRARMNPQHVENLERMGCH